MCLRISTIYRYYWVNMHWPYAIRACFAWYRSRATTQNTRRHETFVLLKQPNATPLYTTISITWQGAFFEYSAISLLSVLLFSTIWVYRFTNSLNNLWIWMTVVTVFFHLLSTAPMSSSLVIFIRAYNGTTHTVCPLSTYLTYLPHKQVVGGRVRINRNQWKYHN